MSKFLMFATIITSGSAAFCEDLIPPSQQVVLVMENVSYDGKTVWVPDARQIREALSAILRHLDALRTDGSIRGLDYILANFSRYHVQFAGYKVGERAYIFCNFLLAPEKWFLGWDRSLVIVKDGGPNFWSIEYDPAEGSCTRLSVNGEA